MSKYQTPLVKNCSGPTKEHKHGGMFAKSGVRLFPGGSRLQGHPPSRTVFLWVWASLYDDNVPLFCVPFRRPSLWPGTQEAVAACPESPWRAPHGPRRAGGDLPGASGAPGAGPKNINTHTSCRASGQGPKRRLQLARRRDAFRHLRELGFESKVGPWPWLFKNDF